VQQSKQAVTLDINTVKLIRHSFCEEDYAVTYYVAEFVNSLTNLAYGM
jgi:hypothetical protein